MQDSLTEEQDSENKERAVKRAMAILREHFQCGVVLVSSAGDKGTGNMGCDFGNHYACLGMAEEYIGDWKERRNNDFRAD